MTEKELIHACKSHDRKAQKMLYDRYSPKLFGLCKRYVKGREDAEDVLLEGFFKIFKHIQQYSGSGSFEGWMRRIVVNEALMFLRKGHNFKADIELNNIDIGSQISVEDELAAQDILDLLDLLPTGYRTVFNLYVLEGYKHREIAEILNISINTSKSQLILARKKLQGMIRQRQYPDVS
ncbi:MAG: sigma-70 family RNA polymerase sigma factor [Bacteroidota bacterium]